MGDDATSAFSTSRPADRTYSVSVAARETVGAAGEASVAPAGVAARPGGWWAARVAGWALIGACVLLVVVGLVAGERTSSYEDLRAAVARGDVDQVTVSQAFSGEFQGRATVEVYWRTWSGWRVAQAIEQHPVRRDRIDGLPVRYDVGADLQGLDTGLEVERRTHWRDRSADTELLGWRLPAWTGLVMFGVWAAVLMLIVGGPPPWRATRWAWFWLLAMAAPVGVVAFALFGGPCGLLPPAPGRRPGLRGGWGFLLALLVGSAIGTVGS